MVAEKVVLAFSEFVNEKYYNTIMDDVTRGYVQKIKDGLTPEATEYLDEYGELHLISDGELAKLFKSDFKNRYNGPEGDGLCLAFDMNNSEIELFSINLQCVVWSVKCDINNPQSIIDSTVECLNNCMKQDEIDW